MSAGRQANTFQFSARPDRSALHGPAPNPVDQPAGPDGGIVVEAVRPRGGRRRRGRHRRVGRGRRPSTPRAPPGRLWVELQPEVRTGPERLGPGPAAGQLSVAPGGTVKASKCHWQPRPRPQCRPLGRRRSPTAIQPISGCFGATDGPAQRHRQDLTTEAEPEDGDSGTVGGVMKSISGSTQWATLRIVDRPAGAEQVDVVDQLVASGQGVEQRRLADVGTADHRHLGRAGRQRREVVSRLDEPEL